MITGCRLLFRRGLGGLLVAWLVLGAGCAAWVELPRVDLSGPGWTVWTGQALWEPVGRESALAGELLAARHDNGDLFVTFSKSPLSVFTAHSAAGGWRIEFVERGRMRAGRGRPPDRFLGFVIPQVLAGYRPPAKWQAQWVDESELELMHRDGERLHLVLDR